MKKIMAALLPLPLLFSAGNGALAANETALPTYDIYPTPQSIVYKEETFSIKEEVRTYFEAGVDSYTKDKCYQVLGLKDVLAKESSDIALDSNYTTVALGIYGSGGKADSLVASEKKSFIGEKIDAYYLSIDGDSILILGKDSDAIYYGLSSLQMIFEQSSGKTITSLEISDYSDSKYRGFIEGFYGLPWTPEERISLMEFASRFKSNIYIYAPKDDSYHASNWRSLYTENDLAILKEQIEAGRKTKTRLAWAIHPFLSQAITESNYEEGLSAIKNKFEQIYEAGVRQFVVSADDVDTSAGLLTDGSLHRKLLNDLVVWNKEKGDCYDLVFVPSGYCYRAEERLGVELNSYFSTLMEGLDPSVEIMWTGNDVCSKVSTGCFDIFSELTGKKSFMWLNWPVNDYSTSHLLLGKAEVLDMPYAGTEPEFVGLVTNPMQQAEASKLSIFAISDYAWNTEAFDVDKSYEASFKYVEAGAPSSLKNIATHLTNATLYEGEWFEEAPDLALLKDSFDAAYAAGNDLNAALDALDNYFSSFLDDISNYKGNATNGALKDSILPWVDALEDTAKAASLYIDIIKNVDALPKTDLESLLANAESAYEEIGRNVAPVLNKITYNTDYEAVEVGTVVMTPLLGSLKAIGTDLAYIALGRSTGVTYQGFTSIYEGSLSNITDGDDSTYCWFGSSPSSNAYIRVDLGEVTTINDIRIYTGNAAGNDTMLGSIEYSVDGRNFTYICDTAGALTTVDLRDNPIEARFIRLKDRGTGTWVSVKEIQVNVMDPLAISVTAENINLEASVDTSLDNMVDGDLSTFTWFDINRTAGATITIDYREVKTANSVALYMAKDSSPYDYFSNVSIYGSLNGTEYFSIGENTYSDMAEIEINLDTPVSLRYLRLVSNETGPYGIVIREFGINLI